MIYRNRYIIGGTSMIPELTREGLLPPGVHEATLGEVRRRFGTDNPIRVRLMKGLESVAAIAGRVGARVLYLDGSFVTDKKDPRDWDAVVVAPIGTNCASREVLRLVDRPRLKKEFGGDVFLIMEDDAELLNHYVGGVFVKDRLGRAKGLVRLHLGTKEKGDGTDQG
jgi:hypothetical protein